MTKEIIKSKQNPHVKNWKKLLTGKGRQQSESYLVEGVHLVQEAILSEQPIEYLIVKDSFNLTQLDLQSNIISNYKCYYVSNEIAKEISPTKQSQGIFAVIKLSILEKDFDWSLKRYLLVDGVQDPGNLGTLVRTADAAGFNGIVLGDGTVDLYNDKVIRATQGSLWHLSIIQYPISKAISNLKANQCSVFVTALHQEAQDYREVNMIDQSMALIVGNEGQGVSQDWIQLADQSIYIPMKGQAESLNVAIAGAILMFHFN